MADPAGSVLVQGFFHLVGAYRPICVSKCPSRRLALQITSISLLCSVPDFYPAHHLFPQSPDSSTVDNRCIWSELYTAAYALHAWVSHGLLATMCISDMTEVHHGIGSQYNFHAFS